jgi:hypothetical protein
MAYVGHDPAHDLAAARDAGLVAVDAGTLATLAELPRALGIEPSSAAPEAR